MSIRNPKSAIGIAWQSHDCLLNERTLYPPFHHWFWLVSAFLLGACIGSFLNVVIYRLPLGLSVNDPKRSFCPKCKSAIPLRRNIPLLSWLLLGGKCHDCKARIPFRYFGVELLTALLFAVAWWVFPPQVAPFLWVMLALLVAITFIDAEHLIIPTELTWAGSVVGLIACAIWPKLPQLAASGNLTWLDGVKHSAIGWATGFFGLWGVVELGKLAFGKLDRKFETAVAWNVKEGKGEEDPLEFTLGEEMITWWDIFSRKTDRLVLDTESIVVDGETLAGGQLVVRESEFQLPDGTLKKFEDIRSLEGTATRAVIPREAMGMGDIHLLGMIGAFFGWGGMFFTLFAASLYAIVAALIGRIGFGKALPFGPYLALGGVTWAFGGWKLWEWYLGLLGPGGF